MQFEVVFEKIKALEFDKRLDIVSDGGVTLFVLRPSKVSSRFINYDINKNFQIWLSEGRREFKPNHLRLMIDLNLRVRSRPDLKSELLAAFDAIYHQTDPDVVIEKLQGEAFDHFLNTLRIIAHLSQLFIIEQLWGYNKESRFDPPYLFYQGWVRQCLDNTKEIDNLVMSIARGNPPDAKYTKLDNRKHKDYSITPKPLWYLD